MRTLLLVVLLALWPGAARAEDAMPPGVFDGTADCISQHLGPTFIVTRIEDIILVNDVLAFGLSRRVPDEVRGDQVPKIGGDQILYWSGADPLWPPVLLSYSAPMAHGSRDLRRDPLYAVGIECLIEAYPPSR